MLRKVVLAALALASFQAAWCQPAVLPPYSSNYTLVSLGPVPEFSYVYYGSLTFLNPSTLLLTDPVDYSYSTIYQLPVTRGANGHITGLGTPVSYAAAQFLDIGLAFGPGGVLFANTATEITGTTALYEFKPGSSSPDLTVGMSTSNFPIAAVLQFVPTGLPGAGGMKMVSYDSSGAWYDVALSANGSGTYNVSGVTGPGATATPNTTGIFYVPPGSPQFSSPSVVVGQYYNSPTMVYAVDADGNPTGAPTPFISIAYSYGATFDPFTGDMFFTTTQSGEAVWEVQGFSPATLTAAAPQSAIVAKPFANPLTITLKDPYGNPISGVTVKFTAPASGATATLSATSAVTAADGTASVTATANATAGSYAVTATLYGLSANFSLTNVALSSVALSPASVVGGDADTANTVKLTSTAPAAGATITLSSSDPSVAAVPASVVVAGGSTTSAPFAISTTPVAAQTHVTIKASDGTDQKNATLTVKPPAPSAVKLSPKSATGGKSTTGNTVTLNGPAPAGGAIVTLSSGDPTAAAVPASVTVAAGATASPAFTISTTAVAADIPVTISATYNGVTKTATLTVNAPQLSALRLSPASVVGGKSTTRNTVKLNGPAPIGGASVMLTSGNATVAAPPLTVMVAAGATSATFTITTTAVTANTVVPITATFGSASKTANVTVTP